MNTQDILFGYGLLTTLVIVGLVAYYERELDRAQARELKLSDRLVDARLQPYRGASRDRAAHGKARINARRAEQQTLAEFGLTKDGG